ncbi:MAG: Gfo/Idh/MocA family oxidoreductase [Phycisphaerae bacterium]
MRPFRIGLIGTGGIMRWAHMNGWTALRDQGRVELVAACDIRREAAESLAEEQGIPNVFEDYRKMFRAVDLDVVDVATPNMFHAPAALAGFKAGCHVYCEKPLAPTPGAVRQLIEARDKAGKKLMTGQHMRFEGKNQALKRYIDAGMLGDFYYARASMLRRRGAPGWGGFLKKELSGGGPLIDLGVHVLDLTLWMMGFPTPVSVCGTAPTKLANLKHVANQPGWGNWKRDGKEFNVEDFAVGLVRFENGAVLVLETSFLLNMVESDIHKVMICGTLGGVDVQEGKVMTQEHGIIRVSQLEDFEKPKAHGAAIIAFIEAIEKNKPVPVPPEETLQVTAILDGIYRSHAKGGAEVKLKTEPSPKAAKQKRRPRKKA